MANKYFTQLTQITAGSVASGDAFAIEDISGGETKYIVASDVATYVSSTLAGASGGWDAVADTWTYLGTTTNKGTVTIPAGGTLLYGKGDKVKFAQGGTQLYFYIIDASLGTALVLTGGSDYALGTATISSVYYSKIENPLDFPHWFNFNSVPAGYSVNPTGSYRFAIQGRLFTFELSESANGTSNATTKTYTAPFSAAKACAFVNSVAMDAGSLAYMNTAYFSAGVISMFKGNNGAWTNSGACSAFGGAGWGLACIFSGEL